MLLSHEALLRYQRYHCQNPWEKLSTLRSGPRLTSIHSIICATAVITRILGKSIAVFNALWILAWSLMTYSNAMETPYCTTAYFSLHDLGWMRLWNFDPEQFIYTKTQELMCLMLGSTVAFFACILTYVMSVDGEKRRKRYYITGLTTVVFVALVVALTDYGLKQIKLSS
jgi:hypothetical protein